MAASSDDFYSFELADDGSSICVIEDGQEVDDLPQSSPGSPVNSDSSRVDVPIVPSSAREREAAADNSVWLGGLDSTGKMD